MASTNYYVQKYMAQAKKDKKPVPYVRSTKAGRAHEDFVTSNKGVLAKPIKTYKFSNGIPEKKSTIAPKKTEKISVTQNKKANPVSTASRGTPYTPPSKAKKGTSYEPSYKTERKQTPYNPPYKSKKSDYEPPYKSKKSDYNPPYKSKKSDYAPPYKTEKPTDYTPMYNNLNKKKDEWKPGQGVSMAEFVKSENEKFRNENRKTKSRDLSDLSLDLGLTLEEQRQIGSEGLRKVAAKQAMIDSVVAEPSSIPTIADLKRLDYGTNQQPELSIGDLKRYDYLQSSPDPNYKKPQMTTEEAFEWLGTEHPVWSTIGTLPMLLVQSAEGLDTTSRALFGRGLTMADQNPNDSVMQARYGADVADPRLATKGRKIIRQAVEDQIDSGAGKVAYNIGTGLADMGTNVAMAGGNPIAMGVLSGTQNAAENELAALERGVDPQKAAEFGTVTGAIAGVLNSVGLDAVINTTGKTVVTSALKAAGTEGLENVVEDIADNFFDCVMNGDNAEVNQTIAYYKQNGLSDEEAYAKTFEGYAAQELESFASGALLGGTINAGKTVGGKILNGDLSRAVANYKKANKADAKVELPKFNPDTARTPDSATIAQAKGQDVPNILPEKSGDFAIRSARTESGKTVYYITPSDSGINVEPGKTYTSKMAAKKPLMLLRMMRSMKSTTLTSRFPKHLTPNFVQNKMHQ